MFKLTQDLSRLRILWGGCLLLATACAFGQTLPDMPAIPDVRPPQAPGSVAMGNPKQTVEVKMDFPIASGPFEPTWESVAKNYPGEPAWLREAKFGIWVHFGPQSAGQSGDWYARRMYIQDQTAYKNHIRDYGHPSQVGYKDVLRTWNPTQLDPAKLVETYHAAGARFLIIQGVHHDNFDNWNSKYQPWNSVNMGPKRDLLGEWSAASRKAGMHYGVAFHHEYTWWWYQPAFGADATGPLAGARYDGGLTLADGQGKWWQGYDPRLLYGIDLREYKNITNFEWTPVEGIFTGHQEYAKWYATWWALRILDVIDKYDPDFIYTDGNSTQPFSGYRSGTGMKSDAVQRVIASFYNRSLQRRGKVDTFSIIKFHPPANGIVNTSEDGYPATIKTDQPWIGETPMGDWFYAPTFDYTSAGLIRYLLECVSRDGSACVCISPRPDGSLDDGSRQMLKEVGDWMHINGAGIYRSKAWSRFGEAAKGKPKGLPQSKLGKAQADFVFDTGDFRFTIGSDGALYAYCMTVPPPGAELKIRSLGKDSNRLAGPIHAVSLLGSEAPLSWHQDADALVVTVPAEMPFHIAVCLRVN